MKNLKKVLSFFVALSISATLAAPAFAETLTVSVDGTDILGSTANLDASEATVETVIQPEILLFRDYEDYTNGADPLNGGKKYGIYGVSGTAKFHQATTVKSGADGNGIQFNTSSTNTVYGTVANGGLPETLNDGILYIAVDVAAKTDAEFDAQDGTVQGIDAQGAKVGHQNYFRLNQHSGGMYLRFATQHSANTSLGDTSGTTAYGALIDSNVHRIEWIIDLSGDKATAYIDGVQVNESVCSLDISALQINLTNGIGYWDNFTIVHYPTDCNKTYSLTGKAASITKGTLTVDVDSDAKTEVTVDDATTTYTANYPVILTEELTAENFTVTNEAGETVEVESVTKNKALGSYDLKLAGGVVGGTYTVTLTTDAKDNLGATLNNATATVTAVSPKVLCFRDYEDYTNGADPLNGGKKYGIYGVSGTAKFHQATTVKSGADGNGIQFNTSSTNTVSGTVANGGLPETLNDGILYIAVDVAAKTDAEFDAQDGTSEKETKVGHQNYIRLNQHNGGMYLRFATQHSANTSLGDTSGTTAYGALIDSKVHRIEWIIDLSGDKATAYIDGVKVNERVCSLDISALQIQLTNGIGYWDNFTIVHYPTGAENTFSIAGKGASYETNTITVDFDSNAKSDGLTANYPVILTKTMTPSDFNVTNSAGETIAVSDVVKNTAFGSYDLVLEDTLIKGETYTVSTAADLETALGATLDISKTATVYIEPDIWHDYDFEESEKPSGWANAGSDYRVQVDIGKYGKGMALNSEKTAKETFTPKQTINKGVVNISFDYMDDAERAKDEFLSFNYGIDRKYVFYATGDNKFKMGKNNLADWGDDAKVAEFAEGKLYHLDLVFDFDNLEYKAYVNGTNIATSTLSSANNIQNTYWAFDNTYFFDNFKMAKVLDDSFRIQKASWNGAYAEVLLSEGASEVAHGLTVDQFTVVDVATGTAVTPTSVEVVGRRVIFEGLDNSKDYRITLPEGYANFLGTALADREVTIEGLKLRITDVKITVDENGTPLTAENVPAVGGTVYAEVTYTNTTGEDVTFMVLGATYSANRMTNAIAQPVVALKTATAETKVYLPIEVTNATDFTAKAFAVNNLTSITPIN